MKKPIRRIAPPDSLDDALFRRWQINDALYCLKRAHRYLVFAPNAKAATARALKSAEGALRHADGLVTRHRSAAKEQN